MSFLFADAMGDWWNQHWPLVLGGVLLVLGVLFLVIFFSFVRCGFNAC